MQKGTLRRLIAGVATATLLAGGGASVQPAVSAEVSVSRIGGTDRYETSALISQAGFAPGVDTVFVVSGQNYPDALAVGPAAGKLRAPVLLTRTQGLPGTIAAELDRLDPQHIVVVGGAVAVSDAVVKALGAYAPDVRRIAGVDRYDTAALVSRQYFDVAIGNAYVASGENFPDALPASAAGGHLGAPVLLTAKNNLPPVTDAALERLDAKRLMVVGGESAISDAVLGQILENTVIDGYRLAGSDRYETSAAVSAHAFGQADTVFLANGMQYPDALSGASLAALRGGPVLLVSNSAVSPSVCREIDRLNPSHVVALGGSGSVNDAALTTAARGCAGLPGAPAPVPTPTPTPTPGVPTPGGDVPPAVTITCSQFQTQRQAQDFYDYWVGKGFGDFYHLDDDGDGTPCEDLPRT